MGGGSVGADFCMEVHTAKGPERELSGYFQVLMASMGSRRIARNAG